MLVFKIVASPDLQFRSENSIQIQRKLLISTEATNLLYERFKIYIYNFPDGKFALQFETAVAR
jgi:hypothetical protein